MATALIGKEDWLFLANDTNNIIDQITGKKPLSQEQIALWQKTLQERENYCQQRNIKYQFVIIPNKECVYSEFLPNDLVLSNNRSAIQLSEQIANVIYPLKFFQQQKLYYDIYYKTDTHWNALGCVLFMNALASSLHSSPIHYEIVSMQRAGDLGVKLDPKRSEISKTVKVNSTTTCLYDNGIWNVGHIAVYENTNKNLPVGVIFGDSFIANHLNLVSQYFSKMFFFHASVFDPFILNKLNPNIILNINIERFVMLPNTQTFTQSLKNKILLSKNISIMQEECYKLKNENYADLLDCNVQIYYDFIQTIKDINTYEDWLYTRYVYLLKHKLIHFEYRRLIGSIWRGQRDKFVAWGIFYLHSDERRGICFYLDNIFANEFLTLSFYLFPKNKKQLDLS